jgi:mannosyltransferase
MQPHKAAVEPRTGTSPLPTPSAGLAHWLTVLLLIAAGTTARFLFLVRKPFWFDECFSVEVARISGRNFAHLLWWREANMSLYYLLLRIWLQFGQREFYIRSLSVLLAAATIPAIYWLARLLYDRRVALIAAGLFAFNAYSVRYAQEARSYALFLLLATLSSGLLVAFVRAPTRGCWRGYVVISALAVYSHFYALLLFGAHWLAIRWLGVGRGGTRNSSDDRTAEQILAQLWRAWIAIGVAVLPLLVFVAKTGAGPIRWILRPSIRDVLEFYQHLAGGSTGILPTICAAACLAAVVPFGKRLLNRDQPWETWRIQFLLIWLLFPVALTVVLSFARPVFLGRYMIFCLPPLLILVGAGLARLRSPWLLAGAVAGTLLLGSQGILFVYGHDFDNERDASTAAASFILDHAQPGDAIVFHIAETRIPYEFVRSQRSGENTASAEFTSRLGPEIVFPYHGAGLDYRDFTGKPTADLLRSIASTHSRVWVMLMNNGPAGNPDPTTALTTKILLESFPKSRQWAFTKVEVRLYEKESEH